MAPAAGGARSGWFGRAWVLAYSTVWIDVDVNVNSGGGRSMERSRIPIEGSNGMALTYRATATFGQRSGMPRVDVLEGLSPRRMAGRPSGWGPWRGPFTWPRGERSSAWASQLRLRRPVPNH